MQKWVNTIPKYMMIIFKHHYDDFKVDTFLIVMKLSHFSDVYRTKSPLVVVEKSVRNAMQEKRDKKDMGKSRCCGNV